LRFNKHHEQAVGAKVPRIIFLKYHFLEK